MSSQYPLKMIIPPDRASQPGLSLPSNQWQRLPDGGIEVVFNTRAELEACVEVTQAVRALEEKQ